MSLDTVGVPVPHGALGWSEPTAPYRPRRPERSILHRVVREELETFVAQAEERGETVAAHVQRELREYIRRGVVSEGFAWGKCDDCGQDYLVGLSCKGRSICAGCTGRRMHDSAAHLVDRVLPHVPVRQWVLTVPKRVRYFLERDPKLVPRRGLRGVASGVLDVFVAAVRAHYRRQARAAGHHDGQTGSVTAIQRFGAALNRHLHYHSAFIDKSL